MCMICVIYREYFTAIAELYLLLAVFYVCYAAEIHSTIQSEVVLKVMRIPGKLRNNNK